MQDSSIRIKICFRLAKSADHLIRVAHKQSSQVVSDISTPPYPYTSFATYTGGATSDHSHSVDFFAHRFPLTLHDFKTSPRSNLQPCICEITAISFIRLQSVKLGIVMDLPAYGQFSFPPTSPYLSVRLYLSIVLAIDEKKGAATDCNEVRRGPRIMVVQCGIQQP